VCVRSRITRISCAYSVTCCGSVGNISSGGSVEPTTDSEPSLFALQAGEDAIEAAAVARIALEFQFITSLSASARQMCARKQIQGEHSCNPWILILDPEGGSQKATLTVLLVVV